MIHTIRVTTATDVDPLGQELLAEIGRTLQLTGIHRVRTVMVYRFEGIGADDAKRLATTLLANDVDQRWALDAPVVLNADRVVEVAYRPGVMNPEAASITKAAADLGVEPVAVDSSREYAFYGELRDDDLDRVLSQLLVNPTVERVVLREPDTLRITGEPGTTVRVPIRAMDDDAMRDLSNAGLYLALDEMQTIRAHFKDLARDPTDLELEALAQTWSEHCVHKTFRSRVWVDGVEKPPFMTRLKETAAAFDRLVVSAFVDNSGVMKFYDGWAVAGKVETHNSPSAIEPYGGAMTGSGGVFRDVLGTGQGAAVIASTDMFCFAPPDLPDDQVPPGALRPDYLLRKVVAGVRDYGNRMGIPTNNGSVHFHRDFRAKPTVIVGSYGVLPERLARKGEPLAGDRILALGGRTGRDGIHGATFSSAAMTAATMEVNSQAVQIGNPIEEKRLVDAVLACRDAGLIRAITDCGAGGFSSAIGEMGEHLGAEVQLDRAPLKYTGLAPWEIFLSESQERMVMAVSPEDADRVRSICRRYNVEVTDLGSFGANGRLVVRFGEELVGDLAMAFLHDGWPSRRLIATWREDPPDDRLPDPPQDAAGWLAVVSAVLSHPNVASKEPIVRQYDHTVQGTCALAPFGGPDGHAPMDAAVVTPVLGEPFGLVIAHGLNPVLNTLDPYWGGVWAAAEAISNLVAVGGNPREASLIDNFIWPFPTEASLGGLDRAVDACVDVMRALQLPFISGKDSLSSTYQYPDGSVLEIPPVLCVSAFGRIADVAATVTSELKAPGSALVLVGAQDIEGMGGAVWLDTCGLPGNHPPRVDLATLPRVLDAVHEGIRSGRVLACHDVSEGGLLVAIAEMAFGGGVGADVDTTVLAQRPDIALFNETAGVFVVEVTDEAAAAALFAQVPHTVIGRATARETLHVRYDGSSLFEAPLADLRATWQHPLQTVFH